MILEVRDLRKSFRSSEERVDVLRGVDFSLRSEETAALIGESGSGKSTLLHLIAGLEHADSGEICFEKNMMTQLSEPDLAKLRRCRIGVIFQQFNLISSLRVADNLAFQARLAGRFYPDWQSELIDRLGLKDLLQRYPEQLSGGQQQRVAIGRALALKPALLLADEPTGNLDESTADDVLRLILDLVRRTGCGFLMATHSTRLAATLNRQVHLSGGRVT
jgi:putative ABC transport system ATP-binding protein